MLTKDAHASNPGVWCGLNKPEMTEQEADTVIFGIPFDEAVSYRGGAGEAPKVLRENTYTPSPYTENFESFATLNVHDAGDFEFVHGQDREAYFEEIAGYVAGLVRNGTFFVMVGGDHSTTIPVLRGIDLGVEKDFGIIHIDAHFDLCDHIGGDRLSHGSTERRALELDHVSGTENMYFVGIRSIETDEYEFKKNHPLQVASARECFRKGMEAVGGDVVRAMSRFHKVYITLDIDGLDPGFAPGTGTPQFGGLVPRQVLDLLEICFEKLNIIGMDVVEISPKLDPSLTSMFAGRKLIQEAWGHLAKRLGKLEE
jgi:agmatinase